MQKQQRFVAALSPRPHRGHPQRTRFRGPWRYNPESFLAKQIMSFPPVAPQWQSLSHGSTFTSHVSCFPFPHSFNASLRPCLLAPLLPYLPNSVPPRACYNSASSSSCLTPFLLPVKPFSKSSPRTARAATPASRKRLL